MGDIPDENCRDYTSAICNPRVLRILGSTEDRKQNRIGDMKCPKCGANWKQYKAGFNPSGSQRYRCGECNRVYTPTPTHHGYSEEIRLLAIRMYVEGSSYGSIGRVLKVNPQSVANWVSAYTAKLPNAPLPEKVKKAELDELFTFVGKKKTKSTS